MSHVSSIDEAVKLVSAELNITPDKLRVSDLSKVDSLKYISQIGMVGGGAWIYDLTNKELTTVSGSVPPQVNLQKYLSTKLNNINM